MKLLIVLLLILSPKAYGQTSETSYTMEGVTALLLLGPTIGGMGISDSPIFAKDKGVFGSDKIQHWGAGVAVAMGTRAIASRYTNWSDREIFIASCVASTTVGVLKEFYDRDIAGTDFEVVDALYTGFGCLTTFQWEF